MPTYPRSPQVLRGALVGMDLASPIPRVVIFQYNPDNLVRTLKSRGVGEGGRAEPMRLLGAPEETIKLDVELDAADKLEQDDGIVKAVGLHPQLAALEMLTYPASATVIANTALLAAGVIEVLPPMGPFTLLIWGPARILPVRITEYTLTEEAYDQHLNPIRVKASVSLRVLSYSDLTITNPFYYVFIAHQVAKEVFAAMGTIGDLSAVAGANVKAS